MSNIIATECTIAMSIRTAAQTEVLSLQQMCIDAVAKTLCSPKDVQLLPLPSNIKEMIAKVVFDPDVDFCFFIGNTCNARLAKFDTTIDYSVYKSLITALR